MIQEFTRRDTLGMAGALCLPVNAEARGTVSTIYAAAFKRVTGFAGSYASAIFVSPTDLVMFSSAIPNNPNSLGLIRYEGPSLAQPKSNTLVLPNSGITDIIGGGQISRICVDYSAKDKMFYGVIYVSDTYPPTNGRVFPAFISSPTGLAGTWIYHGQFGGEVGRLFPKASWGSGMSLIINDNAGALDPIHPSENKFVFYTDAFGPQIALLYSSDGISWNFYRDNLGRIAELLSPELVGETAIFASAIRVPSGWHMYYTNSWPPKWHRHLVSQDGIVWALHGTVAKPEFNSTVKNVNLTYDKNTNRVYALQTIFSYTVPYLKDYSYFDATY